MLGMMLGRMLMIQLVFMGRLLSWDVGAVALGVNGLGALGKAFTVRRAPSLACLGGLGWRCCWLFDPFLRCIGEALCKLG